MGGTPVFRGTRVPIQTLIDFLTAGDSIDDFLEGFPTVSREQVVDFLGESKSYTDEKINLLHPWIKVLIYSCLTLLGIFLVFVLPGLVPASSLLFLPILSGFFISFFSMAGLTAAFVRAFRPPTTVNDAVDWELERAVGRRKYVLEFVTTWTLPSFGLVSALAIPNLWNQGFSLVGMLFYLFLLIVTFLSVIGVASRLWKSGEYQHDLFMKMLLMNTQIEQKQPDNSNRK